MRVVMKPGHLLCLIFAFLPITACYRLGVRPSDTPLPLPTELSTTPLREGFQPGGLEAVFVSVASIDGEKESRCYKMYRFYPDGLALYADQACFDTSPAAGDWSKLERWFNRENREIARGDYFLLGQRIWVRIVEYNPIYETTSLRSFQGEYCQAEMVLQEPTQKYYAGIPSDLTQPVLEFVGQGAIARTPSLSSTSPGGQESGPESCHVAGFRIIWRPSVALAGGQAEFKVQTDPGESCTLQYIAPDGTPSQTPGTGAITADNLGICRWTWEVGALEGVATVTIRIDEISQDFQVELR